MSVPQHTISIFSRPKEGNTWIRRCPVLNYQHTISAMGWFDTAKCDIAVRSQGEGQEYLDRFLGCRVFAYADNPYEPIWEGFINRITFNAGGIAYTISLDEMANRVIVKYSNDSVTADGTGTNAVTTTANTTASQNIYGIKCATIEFGYNRNGNTGHPNALRDTILAQRAYPQTSITKGAGNTNLVTLEMCGFYETLKWDLNVVTGTGTTQFNTRITTDVLPNVSNGATFFDNTDFGAVSANAIATTGLQRNMDMWEYILKIAEAGDASNYWIAGIEPTNPQTNTRRLYYRQVASSTFYTARQRDGLQVRNLYGKLVPPWSVVPDKTILVSDALVGYIPSIQTDPRLTYIFRIEYDANAQSVQWFGADDTTASGAWMLRRGFKPIGRRFGATLRQAAN